MSNSKNTIVIASAGSGKTTGIIEKVKNNLDKNILITTYTNYNIDEIISKFIEDDEFGFVPENIDVMTLYQFLFTHGAKPHQNAVIDTEDGKIKSVDFKSVESHFKNKTQRKYYLNKNNDIFKNKLTDFVLECNNKSGGQIIKRLEKIYDLIIIDEIQDITGSDHIFIKLLLKSNINVYLVGDHRQAILNTHNAKSGKKSEKGVGIINLFEKWQNEGLCDLKYENHSYRCCQEICDFSDKLFPDIPKTQSRTEYNNEDQGIFVMSVNKVAIWEYYEKYKRQGVDIQVVRFDKSINVFNLPVLNIGVSKGKTYDRVIIFFSQGLCEYLSSNKYNFADMTKSKLYVALTRARYSVLLVSNEKNIRFSEVKRIDVISDQMRML